MIKGIHGNDVSKLTSGQVIIDLKAIAKELVENSIDAGANNIEVIFTNYGVDLVSVQDNGTGILPQDFDSLCLRSHTSKLSQFEDLTSLTTLGFRGEALNSICSLSDSVKITTVPTSEGTVNKIYTLEYDSMGALTTLSFKPTPQQTGTTIFVEKLFHNLPVRHKNFIKNSKKEFHKAINCIINYILIHPHIKFSVVNILNGKKVPMLNSKGGANSTMLDNIITIFGTESSKNLLPLNISVNENILINGYISNHSFGFGGRTNIDRQFLYINLRPIHMKRLSRLVNETYKLFNQSQHPVFVLNLQINSNMLDVNLTPDKTTISMQDEAKVLSEVQESLSQFYESQSHVRIPRSLIKVEKLLQSSHVSSSEIDSSSIIENLESNEDPLDATIESLDDSIQYSPYVVQRVETQIGSNDLLLRKSNISTPLQKSSQSTTLLLSVTNYQENSQVVSKDIDNSQTLEETSDNIHTRDVEVAEFTQPSIEVDDIDNPNTNGGVNNTIISDDVNIEGAEPFSSRSVSEKSEKSEKSSSSFLSHSHDCCSVPKPVTELQEKLDIDKISSSFRNKRDADDLSTIKDGYGKNFYPVSEDEVKVTIGDQEWWQPSFKRLRRDELYKIRAELHVEPSDLNGELLVANKLDGNSQLQIDDISKAKEQEEKLSFTISKNDFLKMRVIGQFNVGFILVSLTQNGLTNLFIIDQHASDEKYNFEKLNDNFEINQQQLIKPQVVELSVVEEVLVIDHMSIFYENGFRFEVDENCAPGKRIRLTSMPNLKGKNFNLDDFNELINTINSDSNIGGKIKCSKIRSICAMKACRSLIMIGQTLSQSTMEHVVQNLATLNKPWNCPHGRPTMRHLVELNNWKDNNYPDYQLT